MFLMLEAATLCLYFVIRTYATEIYSYFNEFRRRYDNEGNDTQRHKFFGNFCCVVDGDEMLSNFCCKMFDEPTMITIKYSDME